MFDGGHAERQRHDYGGDQLERIRGEDADFQRDGDDQPVDDSAQHGGEKAEGQRAAAKEHFADDDAGQAYDHDADAGIDIRIALVLRQHRAGKRHTAVGKGQRQHFNSIHIDGGGAYHRFIIAGGADAQAQMRFEKPEQQPHRQRYDERGDKRRGGILAKEPEERAVEQRLGGDERNIAAGIHHKQVDGIQAAHRQNAG